MTISILALKFVLMLKSTSNKILKHELIFVQVFASFLVAASLYSGVYSDISPFVPFVPLGIAPLSRSYSAHTVNHAVAAPESNPTLTAPATLPLPLPYAAPYFATLGL